MQLKSRFENVLSCSRGFLEKSCTVLTDLVHGPPFLEAISMEEALSQELHAEVAELPQEPVVVV